MGIRPLKDRVLLRPLKQPEKTKSGIFLPESATEKSQQAVVVGVGPGCLDDNGKKIPMDVKVGDKVLYEKFGGTEIDIDGEKHLLVKASEILAITD
jgi:chaperonin GroES